MPYLDDTGLAAQELALADHAELYRKRDKTRDPEMQRKLAPFEHRAFAREFAEEKPVRAAVSLPFAIPAYSAAKALGLVTARSPASMEEVKQGFIGLAEGLRERMKR